MQTIAGLFDTYRDAEQAIRDLRDLDIERDQISILARDTVLHEYVADAEDPIMSGAIGGSAIGGLGGLLMGLSAVTVPGIGPVFAAGTMLAMLGTTTAGAGIGAVTGGLIGALTNVGISERDAHVYAESVRRGSIIVLADVADNHADAAIAALNRANAVDIAARRDTLHNEGWKYFDPNHTPESEKAVAR